MLWSTLLACEASDGGEKGGAPLPTTSSPGAATGGAPLEGGGVVDRAIEFDGRQRQYRLFVPSSVGDGPVALVLILHGNGTDGSSFAEKTDFDAVAEREGFLAVYPSADADAGVWNGGFSQKGRDVDDVAFLTELVDVLATEYPVDPDRVFATGLSGGGMMSYRLACEAPELVAAIAPVSATMVVECDPQTPVSVLHIHGTDDRGIPIDGREDRGFPPLRDVLDRWSSLDGCDPEPAESTEGAVTTTTWEGCDPGIAVQYLVLDGGGHEYPRADLGASIDGPSTVWDFFVEHPRTR